MRELLTLLEDAGVVFDTDRVRAEKDLFLRLVREYNAALKRETTAFNNRKKDSTWSKKSILLARDLAAADRSFTKEFVKSGQLSFRLSDYDTSDPEQFWHQLK